MSSAVVIDAIRTPIARADARTGWFRDVRSDELSAGLIGELVDRTGIDPALIEDVRWGCVQQQGEQGYDIARIAVLMAGLPIETGGVTVNRNCASSLQAINDSAMSIMAGCENVQVAGGVEHMDHIPMTKDYDPAPGLFRKHSEAIMHMGLTAEYLATKYGIQRSSQDEFSLRSHRLAAEATGTGAFARPGDETKRATRGRSSTTSASAKTARSRAWADWLRPSIRPVAVSPPATVRRSMSGRPPC